MDPQINLDGTILHKPCAKCFDCHCQIDLANFAKHENLNDFVLLCKTHYFKRFNEGGGYIGGDKFFKKTERDISASAMTTPRYEPDDNLPETQINSSGSGPGNLTIQTLPHQAFDLSSKLYSPSISSSRSEKFKNLGAAPPCHACLKSVYKMEEILVMGYTWHKKCFTCGTNTGLGCHKMLTIDSYHVIEKKPFCNVCFKKHQLGLFNLPTNDLISQTPNQLHNKPEQSTTHFKFEVVDKQTAQSPEIINTLDITTTTVANDNESNLDPNRPHLVNVINFSPRSTDSNPSQILLSDFEDVSSPRSDDVSSPRQNLSTITSELGQIVEPVVAPAPRKTPSMRKSLTSEVSGKSSSSKSLNHTITRVVSGDDGFDSDEDLKAVRDSNPTVIPSFGQQQQQTNMSSSTSQLKILFRTNSAMEREEGEMWALEQKSYDEIRMLKEIEEVTRLEREREEKDAQEKEKLYVESKLLSERVTFIRQQELLAEEQALAKALARKEEESRIEAEIVKQRALEAAQREAEEYAAWQEKKRRAAQAKAEWLREQELTLAHLQLEEPPREDLPATSNEQGVGEIVASRDKNASPGAAERAEEDRMRQELEAWEKAVQLEEPVTNSAAPPEVRNNDVEESNDELKMPCDTAAPSSTSSEFMSDEEVKAALIRKLHLVDVTPVTSKDSQDLKIRKTDKKNPLTKVLGIFGKKA
jgi:hypothetical protein